MARRATRKAEAAFDAGELAPHAADAVRLMRTLGNEHRLMILCALADGELSVRRLNDCVPLSQSALSQHLAVLREDGLVSTRREAQTIYYHACEGPALEVIRVLHKLYCCARPGAETPSTTGENP